MDYRAPLREMSFILRHIAEAGSLFAPEDGTGDTILAEAGRFAAERLAPLNRGSDTTGATFANGAVTTPPGFREAYAAWAAGGWNGIDLPESSGGMGLSCPLATATMEIWASACMSFALGPVLSQGAAETLIAHGSDALRERYLRPLVDGTLTATMALTEPQAGSDLGALASRAEPAEDGAFHLFGQKIFITCGEHDLTGNILHMVLARLPDAPAGTRGISLFAVPKFLPSDDGSETLGRETLGRETLGRETLRNDVHCAGIEHKLGIHGAPTCTMIFGESTGARGWLVGKPHGGLAAMFTMMNKARLLTGLQGVAIAERAYQQALGYARMRRQGHADGETAGPMSLLVKHPDVRRNLMTMKADITAGRALAYYTAEIIERARHHPDAAERAASEARASLLTPIVKAFCSEIGCTVASLGVQIHGGMGYIEETGAAQHFRDARITPIYEGTNGIQAIDLVMRKVLRDKAATATALIATLRNSVTTAARSDRREITRVAQRSGEALAALEQATATLLALPENEARLAIASPYLTLFGIAICGALLAKGALAAAGDGDGGFGPDFIRLAAFYAETRSIMAEALARTIRAGAEILPAVDAFGDFAV